MQLNLGSFNEDKTTKTRIEESIASNLKLKGLENIPELSDTLRTIFANYELEKGVFKLKNETCENCRHKLKRKGTYDKEIILPGGARLLLCFHQYSCPNCKEKVNRRLGDWFQPGDRYSSNVKSDAARLYLSHLSSYEAIQKELIKIYHIPSLSKRTVRKWLSGIGRKSSTFLETEQEFSGHFVYDEEYIKVFLGNVGVKGANLERIEVYLLLFKDAVTDSIILMLSDSLDKTILKLHWIKFARWTISQGINWETLTTDGKREYNTLVDELNAELELNVKHAYCVFHFKKNLFEVSNKYIFGVMQTKNELPVHVKNQIKIISDVMDLPSKEMFQKEVTNLEYEIQTFIPPLRDQIKRMKKYEKNYTLHKEFPFLRTTNICEHWFGRTKPDKIKKGFKTKKGILLIARALAVKITQEKWKKFLDINKDIEDATKLLIASLYHNVKVI